ncbi:MAG TPA: NADH:flavin oxidoreductase/NADH oxidase [Anaeromyxobacteraceae bacterium]|nr:NADH:flavin oxidoreductase/NADH oxidase [Anaeromyxobacteraceae bacterium]
MAEPTHLFSPLQLRDVRLRNRVFVSPMCMYSSTDGFANDWHLVHLGSLAAGGSALVLTEATAVLPEGRISPWDLGLWDDRHGEVLGRIVRFVEGQGAAAGIQLAHAGRKASTNRPWDGGGPVDAAGGGWQPVAPSAVPFDAGHLEPRALTIEEIAATVKAFAAAARRALDAGCQTVEIHAAHGYLLHQFLSPLSNRRDDRYGGSFENRSRVVREVVEAVRGVWPERLPLLLRISATDWTEGGWSPEESVALSRAVKPLGVDLVDCSSGGLVPARIPAGPSYQVPFAERIRREAGVATGAVGLISEPEQADGIVRAGQADAVFLARELLRNPRWPLTAAKKLGHPPPVPKQYLRAF